MKLKRHDTVPGRTAVRPPLGTRTALPPVETIRRNQAEDGFANHHPIMEV